MLATVQAGPYQSRIADIFNSYKSKQKQAKKHTRFIRSYITEFHNLLLKGEDESSACFNADLNIWTRYLRSIGFKEFPYSRPKETQPDAAGSGPYQSKLARMMGFSATICILKNGRVHNPEEEAEMQLGWDEKYRKAKASANHHESSYYADLWFWERYLSQDGNLAFPYPHLEAKYFSSERNLGTERKSDAGKKTIPITKAEQIRQKHSHMEDIWEKYKEKFMNLHGRAMTKEEMIDFKEHAKRVWTVYQIQYGYMGQEPYPVYRAECDIWACYLSDNGKVPWPYDHWSPSPIQALNEAAAETKQKENQAATINGSIPNNTGAVDEIPACKLLRKRSSRNAAKHRQTLVSSPPAPAKRLKTETLRVSASTAAPNLSTVATNGVIEESSETSTDIDISEGGDDEVDAWYDAMLKNLEHCS